MVSEADETRPWMTVVEMPSFIADARRLLAESELDALKLYLAMHPESGDLIEGTGGARKFRWARPGQGKSGGFRVVTFFHDRAMPVFLLAIFAKNEQANLSKAEKNELRGLLRDIVAAYKARRRKP